MVTKCKHIKEKQNVKNIEETSSQINNNKGTRTEKFPKLPIEENQSPNWTKPSTSQAAAYTCTPGVLEVPVLT